MSLKSAYVIRHLAFENLGNFQDVLISQGFTIKYFEAGIDNLEAIDSLQPDLLVVLGGPIAAYEEEMYPFLKTEIAILKARIASDLPTLGICLGAQLIAKALGANVYQGNHKELGWGPLELTNAGRKNFFQHLESSKTEVLHWHSDTFDLPKGAVLQASTHFYPNQAFTYGNILAIQFHPEFIGNQIEKWLIGHALEISLEKDVTIGQLRTETLKKGSDLFVQSIQFWEDWLASVNFLNGAQDETI